MDISLSILGLDFYNIEQALKPFEGDLRYLHLDVMDGHFVPNISFGPDLIAAIKKHSHFILDTHLMISHPEDYLDRFMEAGSDYLTIHYEAESDLVRCIQKIHACGKKAGVAIKPNTDVEVLRPFLSQLDLILVMSVEPGFGGQAFLDSAIHKVQLLKQWKEQEGWSYLISIDGGIHDQTLPLVSTYVDLAVSGSFITKAKNPLENLKLLKHI